MFKRTALTIGRCTQDCVWGRCIRSHHLAKIHEALPADTKSKKGYLKVLVSFKNRGIYQDQNSERDGQPTPKRLEDGSVGVIHVQENESANLANPMERRFLHDLEFQQSQRFGQNRWLKEEKKNQQEDLKSLTKEITMSASKSKCGGDKDKAAKKKKEEEALKKKCAEDKLKKQCADLAQKEKCAKKGGAKKGGAKKDPCKKDKDGDLKKKCKDMAQKEKCNKMAAEKKKKELEKKCKDLAQKEKCKKQAEKDKKKPAAKDKCKKK